MMGAVKKPTIKVQPKPPAAASGDDGTKSRNMLIGIGAIAVLGSLALYLFKSRGK